MACSKCVDFECVIELTGCDADLRQFHCINNVLYNFNGLCICNRWEVLPPHIDTAEPVSSSQANVNMVSCDCDCASFSLQCDLLDNSNRDDDMLLQS